MAVLLVMLRLAHPVRQPAPDQLLDGRYRAFRAKSGLGGRFFFVPLPGKNETIPVPTNFT
jgi:hypothetical protein